MQRVLEMVGVLAALYIFYLLGMGKWNYVSPAQRSQRRETLKQAGLSTRFYFMHPRTQLLLTLLSGGLFTFYWLYKQWQQIRVGFKRLNAQPLSGSPMLRALGGCWSFFALASLINRTCEYMQKPTSWPAWLWGSLWLGGLVLVFAPVAPLWHAVGYILFCAGPAVYQRRLNTLTPEHISAFPRTVEIIVTLCGAACASGVVALIKMLPN